MKKVIILSTKSRTDIVHSTSKYGGLFLSQYYSPMLEMGDNYQEIYIIDDQKEIKEDDWYIDNRVVSQPIVSNTPMHKDKEFACKKIVASTNSKLNLPLINKEFIELYVEKQGKIEEVDVTFGITAEEMDAAIVTPKELEDDYTIKRRLENERLNQKESKEVDDVEDLSVPLGILTGLLERAGVRKYTNINNWGHSQLERDIVNELIAWQKKRMYSKDEVIEIIYKSSYVLAHGDSTKQDADEWISQNLKK